MNAGIDPGLSGGIALLSDDRAIIEVLDMPVLMAGKGKREIDAVEIRGILSNYNVTQVYLEKAQAMPGQGIVSTGRYLTSYGIIQGICVGIGIPFTLCHPASWKRVMLSDMPKGKDASIIRVRQLYPNLTLKRKKDHNICEAILIALYGMLKK